MSSNTMDLLPLRDRIRSVLPFRYKHHFIHIPKNGGISVRAALDGRVQMTRRFHYRYRDIVSIVDGLRCFAIVRNPWARVYSRFEYARSMAAKFGSGDARREYFTSVSFERFVFEQRPFDIPQHPGMSWMGPHGSWHNQLEWLVDNDGAVRADCLRLEHLSADLPAYLGRPIDLPHRNRSARTGDYRRAYTPAMVDAIAERHAADILHFGFDFDTPATQNVWRAT